jgi:hypothetical protein
MGAELRFQILILMVFMVSIIADVTMLMRLLKRPRSGQFVLGETRRTSYVFFR